MIQTGEAALTADNTPTSGEKTHGSGTGLGLGILTQRVTDMIGATGLQRSRFTRRAWHGKHAWEFEGVKPDGGGGSPGFMDNLRDIVGRALPELPQERYLKDALFVIAQTPTGNALMKSAEAGSVEVVIDTQYDGPGCYVASDRTITVNPRFMHHDGDTDIFTGRLGNMISHELFHAYQDRNGALFPCNDTDHAIEELMLATNHLEAAAYAVEAQIAWEAKEQGNPDLWRLTDPYHHRIFNAFEKAVRDNPEAATNGEARRAAHDAFFENPMRVHYEAAVIRKYKTEMHRMRINEDGERVRGASLDGSGFDAATLEKTGLGPDGVNHLKLPGKREPGDPSYRGFTNTKMRDEVDNMRKDENATGGMRKSDFTSGFAKLGGMNGPKTMAIRPPSLTPPAPETR